MCFAIPIPHALQPTYCLTFLGMTHPQITRFVPLAIILGKIRRSGSKPEPLTHAGPGYRAGIYKAFYAPADPLHVSGMVYFGSSSIFIIRALACVVPQIRDTWYHRC